MQSIWISVKDSLPPFYTQVIVCRLFYSQSLDEVMQIVEFGTRVEIGAGMWNWSGFEMNKDGITHWMPLPEKPKKD